MLFTTVLKDNKAYMRCYRKGKYTSDNMIVAYFYPNKTPYNRVGITAGKKIGNAVERNRVKRIIRAGYRLNESLFPIGYDIIFVGRNDIKEKKTQDIENFIKKRLIKEMNRSDFNSKGSKGKKKSFKKK